MSETYTPEKDITETLPDGRQILVAAAGVAVPMDEAKKRGFVKEPKASGPSETKNKNKELGALEKKLAEATSDDDKAAIQAQIDALKQPAT